MGGPHLNKKQKKIRGSFFWSDSRTGAKSGEVFNGQTVGRSDGGRMEVFTSL